jgi:hypothetical protein
MLSAKAQFAPPRLTRKMSFWGVITLGFLGGDDWHSLTRLVGGTPRKKASTSINQPFLKINNL